MMRYIHYEKLSAWVSICRSLIFSTTCTKLYSHVGAQLFDLVMNDIINAGVRTKLWYSSWIGQSQALRAGLQIGLEKDRKMIQFPHNYYPSSLHLSTTKRGISIETVDFQVLKLLFLKRFWSPMATFSNAFLRVQSISFLFHVTDRLTSFQPLSI